MMSRTYAPAKATPIETIDLADFGFSPTATPAANTAAFAAAMATVPAAGARIRYPREQCLVASLGGAGAGVAESALLPVSKTTHLRPNVKLAAVQPTFCRVFIMSGVSDVTFEFPIVDGNKAAQGATEHQHGFFVVNSTNVRLIAPTVTNMRGDGVGSYNGTTDLLVWMPYVSGCDRNGVTTSTDTTLPGHNLRTRIIGGTLKCRIQPIDCEPDLSGTASTLVDFSADGVTCIVETDSVEPWAIALGGGAQAATGTVRNCTLINGGLYANYGDWLIEQNTLIIGVQLTATLTNTFTTATSVALSGVANGTPVIGDKVFGPGIQAGTTITAVNISAGTMTISLPATASGTVQLGTINQQPLAAINCARTGRARVRRNTVRTCIPSSPGYTGLIEVGAAGGQAMDYAQVHTNDIRFDLDLVQCLIHVTADDSEVDNNTVVATNIKTGTFPLIWLRATTGTARRAAIRNNNVQGNNNTTTPAGIYVGAAGGSWAEEVTITGNRIRNAFRGIGCAAATFGAGSVWVQHSNTFRQVQIRETDFGEVVPARIIGGSEGSAAIYAGRGAPAFVAQIGSRYQREDGAAGSCDYVNRTGAGAGWFAVA